MNINSGKRLSRSESYSQSIKLILLTPKGERVLNRSFGSNINFYIGQPINSVVMELSAEAVSSLQSGDSRISVDKISLENSDNSSLKLAVQYNGNDVVEVDI